MGERATGPADSLCLNAEMRARRRPLARYHERHFECDTAISSSGIMRPFPGFTFRESDYTLFEGS
jgi:hypothetical protein